MKNLPEKRAITLDGQKLQYTLSGRGKPAIVLLNGAGGPLDAWYKLFPEVEQLGTVVSYDRPGVGGSARPVEAQTGEVVVRKLRRLLHELGVAGPFVLVGHSFGGLHANLFARLHPREVAGVVLLEATAPDDVGLMKLHPSRMQRAINGLLNFFSLPDPNDEISNEHRTVADIAAAPAFPDVPLRVVSGGKVPPGWMMSAEALRIRARNQEALAGLSPQGQHIVAERSGHFPQMSQPELVVEAIAQVIAASQSLTDA
jgi:pimeloyl-ACP methyl ester carboxylesterase